MMAMSKPVFTGRSFQSRVWSLVASHPD